MGRQEKESIMVVLVFIQNSVIQGSRLTPLSKPCDARLQHTRQDFQSALYNH